MKTLPGDPHWRCNLGAKSRKYRWETIDEAWLGAWRLWALGEAEPLTPYKCRQFKRYYTHLVHRPHPNPWQWFPVMLTLRRVQRLNRKKRSCGGWHLTRHMQHILPPPAANTRG